MKTQNNSALDFSKRNIVELNNKQLNLIVGGTNSFIHSSIPCWDEFVRQSSLRCQQATL